MIALDITPGEIASRTMTPEHLEAAVGAVRRDGFVVLNKVIDPQHLAVLRERMLADVQAFLEREDVPFNFNTSNIQQDPPPFPPYLFHDVLLNDMAVAVTKAVLGPGLKNNFVFNAATIFWAQGLSSPPGHMLPWSHWSRPHGPDDRVQRITENLLKRAVG